MPNTKRKITAEDLYQLNFLSEPQISRDGDKAVVVVKSIDETTKQYVSHLELIHLQNNTKKVLTRSKHQDMSPRFSPNGQSIVFVSNRSGSNQLWQIPVDGGEAEQLTDLDVGVGSPVFSPEGNQIVFSTRLKPGDELKQKEKGTNDASSEAAKKDDKNEQKVTVIDRLFHKADGAGYWDDKYSQLGVLNLETKEVKRVTDDTYHYREAVWLPEGNAVAAVSNHHEDPDLNFGDDLFVITLDGKVEQISDSKLDIAQVSISPQGDTFAFFANDQKFKNATLSRLFVCNRDYSNLVCLTPNWDQACGNSGMSDMRSHEHTPAPVWSEDGKSLYILSSWHGATQVYNVTLDGQIQQVTSGEWEIYGFDATQSNSPTFVIAATNFTNPGDLYKFDAVDPNTFVRLTSVNESFFEQIELSTPEEFWCKGADGWDIQGWVMKPVGFKDGKKYPTVLEVHGGPHAMYSYSFFHEFQLLCSKGFTVVFSNPRGGEGYGQEFVDAVRGDYGGNDYADLMAVVDHAIASYPFIDADRLGVTGGSYGGFMTNWIVGHTNRFKAAVTQRSISNWLSFYGVSDIGYFFTEWQILGDAWSDTEKLWKHSPIAYVKNVETPLLILHGEQDLRCPIEQADQLFIALKRLGKQVQYVRFPNSNHDLSRSGDPKLRVERVSRIAGWFVDHIPVHQEQYKTFE